MTVIKATDLGKEFTIWRRTGRWRRARDVVAAVASIDLSIDRGETVGYLGPNGAGKSTTLKMFTGILAPTKGQLRVCDLEPVPARRRLARRIGVVFGQRSTLWWDLPLGESFALLRSIYDVPEQDHKARLNRFREFLELDEFIHTPVRQLSLGQRMRGELTAALLHGPEVIFLDEPTIGLDILSKQAVRTFLAELGRKGDTTLMLTTHDLADIDHLCERIVVIDHGALVHDGSVDELHDRFATRRAIVADLNDSWPADLTIPGADVENVSADRRQITLAIQNDGANGDAAGKVIAALATTVSLRDLTMSEPTIEDVIARLYKEAQ